MKKKDEQTWLVTGGSGFIGSTFVRMVLGTRPRVRIINLDALTYAGNLKNLDAVADSPRYRFVRGDIRDATVVNEIVGNNVDAIINFAAETHVDRSIADPETFLRTDILGTHVLLEAARRVRLSRFLQVSTDEVYGHVHEGKSRETDAIFPRSPYAASKAAADLQAFAYFTTYGTPVIVTRGSNTFGPFQHPEKLIPLFITNLIDGHQVPLYGDGNQIREWVHVEDHARGILIALERGIVGNAYNLGGGNARTNLEITRFLTDACERSFETSVRHVNDRPGHDRRYALDSSKAQVLGWSPERDFDAALTETVNWYRDNDEWWRSLKGGSSDFHYEPQHLTSEARAEQ